MRQLFNYRIQNYYIIIQQQHNIAAVEDDVLLMVYTLYTIRQYIQPQFYVTTVADNKIYP